MFAISQDLYASMECAGLVFVSGWSTFSPPSGYTTFSEHTTGINSASNDNGFLIFAEDAAEGVGDFADGGVGFDGREDRREKILCRGGSMLEFGERGLHAGGIAAATKSFHSGDLRALDFFVDAQRRDGPFFFSNEVVNPDHDLLSFLDGPLKVKRNLLNFPLDEAGFDGAQHSPQRIDFRDVFFGAA